MGFLDALHELNQRHERIKKFIHEGFRVPLPKWGRFLAGCVYFSLPIVGGLSVMNWAISKAHATIGEHGENLPIKGIQGIGDKYVDSHGNRHKVGAGGIGAGVRLANSDEETQRRNKEQLEKFLMHQRKLQQRRMKEQESEQ